MRLAITSLYLPGGSKIGVGYQVHHFANQMVLRGHEVTVFSQCSPGSDSLYQCEVLNARKSCRTFGFAWDLRGVGFGEFDALHAHGDDWFLWGRKRPRHIHTYHGSCLAECLHHSELLGKARMFALALCEFGSTALCDECVAVSEGTCDFLPMVRRVIPNGVDLSVFKPGAQKSEKPSILFVGTMRGRKRGDLLLKVFQEEVLSVLPECELWLVCEEKVEAPGVRWFGRVPEEVLCELYRQAWVFCLPSSYEGFGIPYVEAMASGTAVVATPNRGAREVTRGGTCGLLASEGRLGKTLLKVLRDARLRGHLEDMGSKRAGEFGWDRVCGEYEELYGWERASAPVGEAV